MRRPRSSLRFALGCVLFGLSARALPMGTMEMALRGVATGSVCFCPFKARCLWRVHYPGRRSALPWAIRLLGFQPARRQWEQIRCDAPSQVIAPLCPGLCAFWAFSPRSANGDNGNGIAGRCHGFGVLLPFQGAVFVARALPRASLRFALGYSLIGLSARAPPMGTNTV